MLNYKPPPDPDLVWTNLRTFAVEGHLNRIRLGIDGEPVWSYEKDPDSGEVGEREGFWPDHGEMFSAEIDFIAKTQIKFTDGNDGQMQFIFIDDDGQERSDSGADDLVW